MKPKEFNRWLPGYLKSIGKRPKKIDGTRHLLLTVADHYEPLGPGGKQPEELGRQRVDRWRDELPKLADSFRDADGRPPCHSFFFPEEEYKPYFIDTLTKLAEKRLGEVEIHLHHDQDNAADLTTKLSRFRDLLRDTHGCLGSMPDGSPGYVFIHGNWCLCNSRPDGQWCGVNNELTILRETGCYCDMTMPSGASPTQTNTVNDIYYASDIPGQPFSHNRGQQVIAANAPSPTPLPDGGDLLLIQGPLALNWKWRKMGILPRLEYGDLCGSNPPTPLRADLWARQHIHVANKPEWVFVKVHTHGCIEANADVLLGDAMRRTHTHLAEHYNDGERWKLHYVSAREMYNIAKAAEAGQTGDPGDYRDYIVKPPPCI